MKQNPLVDLAGFGQSLWLDYLGRDLLSEGNLERIIRDDGLAGVAVNPISIQNDIAFSSDYDREIRALDDAGLDALEIYNTLVTKDVIQAADLFLPLHESSDRANGYVSVDIDPRIANDTKQMLAAGIKLGDQIQRPNVLVRIPSTSAGVTTIQKLTQEGIKTNAGFIFGLDRYRDVAEAYILGLETRLASGKPIDGICSVASVSVGTLDRLFDPQFESVVKTRTNEAGLLLRLRGQIGIATAKMAYQLYLELFESERFAVLAQKGAQKQRLLWSRTGLRKNHYSDIKYVEALIGPGTIICMPWETLNAYRDHGEPRAQLVQNSQRSGWILDRLPDLGFDLAGMTEQLEEDVILRLSTSFEKTLGVLSRRSSRTGPNTTLKAAVAMRSQIYNPANAPRSAAATGILSKERILDSIDSSGEILASESSPDSELIPS